MVRLYSLNVDRRSLKDFKKLTSFSLVSVLLSRLERVPSSVLKDDSGWAQDSHEGVSQDGRVCSIRAGEAEFLVRVVLSLYIIVDFIVRKRGWKFEERPTLLFACKGMYFRDYFVVFDGSDDA